MHCELCSESLGLSRIYCSDSNMCCQGSWFSPPLLLSHTSTMQPQTAITGRIPRHTKRRRNVRSPSSPLPHERGPAGPSTAVSALESGSVKGRVFSHIALHATACRQERCLCDGCRDLKPNQLLYQSWKSSCTIWNLKKGGAGLVWKY